MVLSELYKVVNQAV